MTWQEFKKKLTEPVGGAKKTSAGEDKSSRAGGKSLPQLTDVVGVELGSSDVRGCPAVRLVRRRETWRVTAIGFVPPPNGHIPSNWTELSAQPVWSLPSAFAAPSAAIAVSSPEEVVRQTTLEMLTDGGKQVEMTAPNSIDGLRFALAPLGEASFVLESGLPEYQVLWLSRLFPEGYRPTAASIQTATAARLAALAENATFQADGGNAAVLFVTDSTVYFVGYRSYVPVLFREFSGIGGKLKIREALKSGFGMDDKMLLEMLDDTLVDPMPILEPLVNPILRQVELSLDYLKSRLGVTVDKVFLMGLSAGAAHARRISEKLIGIPLIAPDLFEGVEIAPHCMIDSEELLKRSQQFLVAFGAARAAMEATV